MDSGAALSKHTAKELRAHGEEGALSEAKVTALLVQRGGECWAASGLIDRQRTKHFN
jgi:hypothetical protein